MGVDDELATAGVTVREREGTGPWDGGSATVPLRDDDPPVEAPAVGTQVGRYLVIEELGRGAMGVVLRAYDPKLSREVALKILRGRDDAEGGRSRLWREAQAMAQLSHPNVVAVYDVESIDQRLVLAMEFVEGTTLRRWLERDGDAGRRWAEIVAAYADAGKGLAAAHTAGLLHRDFKPDNVLVGEDGRVRVTDFGLARGTDTVSRSIGGDEDDDERSRDPEGSSASRSAPLSEALTRVGWVMGTLRYMAPEQHDGAELTPAADQYAFGVALWEALTGAPPFRGEDLASQKRGGPPAWPDHVAPPRAVVRVLVRALAPEPGARWPSMDSLLASLQRATARPGRRRTSIGLGVAVVGVVAAVALSDWQRRRRVAACLDDGGRVADVWNAEAEAAVRAGMVRSGVGAAAQTADMLMPWLHGYAESWTDTKTAACEATHRRGDWDDDMMARAQWCLESRRLELGALVDALSDADPDMTTRAVSAAAELHPSVSCTDVATLLRLPAPPEADPERFAEVREGLSRVSALRSAGAYAAALEQARESLAAAEPLQWPPLTAAARASLGRLLALNGRYTEAEPVLEQAFFEAADVDATAEAFDAAVVLANLVGVRLARIDDGLRWDRHARVLGRGLPDDAGLYDARRRVTLGRVLYAAGRYGEAAQQQREALIQRRTTLGEDHPAVAESLGDLAEIQLRQGKRDDADANLRAALDIQRRVLGETHPDVARSLHAIARLHGERGEYAAAIETAARALKIRRDATGPDHPTVAIGHSQLAVVRMLTGDYDGARPELETALAINRKSLGDDHPQVASMLGRIAGLELATGNTARAHELLVESLERSARVLGADHPNLAAEYNNLGFASMFLGKLDDADVAFRRSIAIKERAHGREHPSLAISLEGLSRIALAAGRPEDALRIAKRAFAIREAAKSPPEWIAMGRFLIATCLGELRADLPRARRMATQAREELLLATPIRKDSIAEIDQWLAAHPADAINEK